MKILQVIPFFSPKFGGSVTVPFELSKMLTKRNHEVTIITTDFHFDPQYANTIRAEGVTVIPFPCVANVGLFLYSPSIKKWLGKNLKEFDIIHLHNYRSYQNVAVHNFAMKFGVPYIVQAHGSILHFFQKQELKKIFDIVWGNKILKDASKLIALTDTEAEQYQKMGSPKNKIEIIPNGIDSAKFENLPDFGKFRKQYEIKENSKIILYIGRFHKTKGLDLLIDAFYELNKIKEGTRLVLAGPDDGYLSAILNKIRNLNLQNEILVIGFISNEEKIQAFIDSDVFVTPSFSGFPVTFLEACACGIPIITTNNGDVLEWINNKVGFVVEYNYKSLRNALIQILNENELKIKFGENGKDLVKKEFNWENLIKKFESAYNRCT